jgi:hypothetical protein
MIDRIQHIQSLSCNTAACPASAKPQEPAPVARGSLSGDTAQISTQGREQQPGGSRTAADRPGESKLDPEQQREINELKKTDRKVKAHERAHMAAGAGLVMGGANYRYQRGPDGKMYAVGGEVTIDTAREKDPKDTVTKMQQVRRAALAPPQPSGQDRSVAARASQIEAEARAEMLKENAANAQSDDSQVASASNPMPAPISRAYQPSPAEPTIQVAA